LQFCCTPTGRRQISYALCYQPGIPTGCGGNTIPLRGRLSIRCCQLSFFIIFMHLTPFTPNPLFPLSFEERGPGGASAARKIVDSVLSIVNCQFSPSPVPRPGACPELSEGSLAPLAPLRGRLSIRILKSEF